ncbi:MAG: glycosyltransferase [Planctomycetaceae bacterium]|jgi:glycosyltransferase involved in cell wall biosynthesis|nr:glycosyltransferase [Planctomycetaceae bacterium]
MRLAFCITELNVGGAERVMCELAVRLLARGHSVTVYSLQPRPVGISCVPQLESAGITVEFLNMRGVFSLVCGLGKLRKLLREQSPDIFISFMFHANFFGRLAAYFAGIKHVVSCIRVAERSAWWHLFLDKWTNVFVERYICVSDSVAEFSRVVGGLPARKISVIRNGIIAPTELKNGTNKIIFVGRLDYQKGVDWLIQTLPSWLTQLKDWELLIVGDGIFRDKLEERIDAKIRNRVKVLGWRADAVELIAESKILLLTSRWEGMPNVILQAMSNAKAVVSTNVEGIAELLGKATEQQTCPFGDTEQFAQKILTIANDPALAHELGQQNRSRAISNYSIDNMVQQYEQLLFAVNS